ncbi:MAG: glycine cleavage system aminomethyltransferase GcvT [Planctomycetia bacterium]|nr:glycine cleavage system aminomethyltransferase GcvT [Planctomycetia bacterium]
MTSMLSQTPLYDWHASHGARMVDFALWSMPVQYASIVAEHNATRNAVGLFDVSHMGRFRFNGPDFEQFLDRIVTRRVAGMRPGQIRYALVTNDDGGILDDVLIYHLRDNRGQLYYQLVVNASNRQKIWDWLEAHRGHGGVGFCDSTVETAMIAVQGPRALEIVRPLSTVDPAKLRYYTGSETEFSGTSGTISRTGYTGEDGCELIVAASAAMEIWEKLFAAAAAVGGTAAGLGCRDTLRLEAGMPLYGHELNEEINPFQAGLGYAVDLENRTFPGCDALLKLRDNKSLPRRVGWELVGKRVPREGYPVFSAGEQVGRVTSGTFSPTLNKPIAMGYIRGDLTAPGTEVAIDIRSHHELARSVRLPFYRRTS